MPSVRTSYEIFLPKSQTNSRGYCLSNPAKSILVSLVFTPGLSEQHDRLRDPSPHSAIVGVGLPPILIAIIWSHQ